MDMDFYFHLKWIWNFHLDYIMDMEFYFHLKWIWNFHLDLKWI